jgi:hypothetical protein
MRIKTSHSLRNTTGSYHSTRRSTLKMSVTLKASIMLARVRRGRVLTVVDISLAIR